MEFEIPLEKMTVSQKLCAIEQIWDNLQRSPGDIPAPSWHKDVLDARERRVQAGKAAFVDWDDLKLKIIESVK